MDSVPLGVVFSFIDSATTIRELLRSAPWHVIVLSEIVYQILGRAPQHRTRRPASPTLIKFEPPRWWACRSGRSRSGICGSPVFAFDSDSMRKIWRVCASRSATCFLSPRVSESFRGGGRIEQSAVGEYC